MFRFFFLCFYLVFGTGLIAQENGIYPVSATVQTLPPFQPNLADWADPLNNRIGVSLLLNDRREPGYQVQLRLRINGPNVEIVTRPDFVPTPIDLDFGVPRLLNTTELAEYFDLDNLVFNGISQQQYLDQNGLPEGVYTICLEAYDYLRDEDGAVSLPACGLINATLLTPPSITYPAFDDQVVDAIQPQMLPITWQANHTGLLATNYTIQIFEDDPTLSPEYIYSNTFPVVEEQTTNAPTAIIGPASAPLVLGTRYLLRVKAEDPSGAQQFQNGGFSELRYFVYGQACAPPTGIEIGNETHLSASLQWGFSSGAANYVVRLREQNDLANWYEFEENFNTLELENLTESTTYEVQIQSVCTAGAGPFGPTYTFSTNDLPFDPEEFDCGSDMADAPPVTNTEPLTQLVYGSQVRINEFYLKITTAERNDDGTWTGTGSIPVNWLGARVNCTFTELGINTDKEVFSGEVVAIDEGLESVEGFLTPEEISELLDTATVDFCGTLLNAVDSTTQDTTVQDTTGQVNSPPPAIDTTGTALPIDTTGISAGTTPPSDSLTQDTIGIITLDSIDNTISYDSLLTISGGTNLPIVAGVGTERIAFYDMTFTTGGATVSAYTSAKTPVGNKFIALGLEDFGFRPNGIQGEQKLQLSSNVSFDWSGKMRLTIKEGGGTYVAFDCFGVTEIGLDIDVELCRDLVVPVDPSTAEATEDGFVTASFTATASSWDEFAGEVSITPFEVPSLPGWTFTIEEAVLDFSETTTPPSVVFPEDYEHPDVLTPTVDNGAPGALNSGFGGGSQGGSQYGEDVENDGTINAGWTGFYLGLARVRVPEQFMASAGQDSTGVSQDSTYVGRDSSQALTIGAYQLIIDDTGFSGGVFATNVLTLNQGQAGGWDLSLDTVAIRIQSNQFESANLNGRIKVPALDGTLTYGCHIQPGGSYAFAIGVADTVSMSAMVASLDLYENTEIGVTYNEEEDDFDAYIILHGKATFRPKVGAQDSTATASTGVGGGGNAGAGGGTTAGQDSTSRFNLPSISFQDFHLSSTRPYLQNIGIWSLASEDDEPAGLKGFPIKINEIGMFQSEGEEDQVALGVDLTLNLKKDTEQGFGANGRLFVICDVKEDPETGKQTWKFNRVRLDRLAIDYVGAGFEFHGFIESFEDDETYGTGFNGGIQASFKPSISVGVVALFGKKDDYRYFFADAMVSFNPGINLGPSGMAIYGFGGGVSYHMQRVGFAGVTLPEQTVPPPDSTATTPVVDSTSIGSMAALQSAFNTGIDPNAAFPPAVPLPTSLGESLTGISYVPDEDIGIGIKATLAFGTVKREVFNGDLTFEIVFNSNGSMNYIGIAGNANFLTPPKTPDEPEPNPAVSAYVEMGYDFMNESFDALLRLRVYVAKGLIQGAYPDYVAGEGKIHASQEDWYIYLGEPETPISLSMDLSRLAKIGTRDDGEPDSGPNPLLAGQDSTSANQPLGSIGDVGLLLTAYLDAGSVLPDFPGIPDQLADRLPEPPDGWNPTNRDDPAFADAGGLLFGSGLHVSMPELKFLIFYASLNAGMGFDMMLKDYGPGAYCANMDDSPVPIGINGWYATGQFYAYLDASIGIEINLAGFNGKYDILSFGAGALLQARLPNPMWMRGSMYGYYSLLNGLVSGECDFEFEAGTLCEIAQGQNLDNLEVIAQLSPTDEAEEVDVFAAPQVAFNVPINQVLFMKDEDQQDVSVRPIIRELTFLQSDGTYVSGEWEWSDDQQGVTFRATDILAPYTEYTLRVVTALELRYPDGEWELLMRRRNKVEEEEAEISFTTGAAPQNIVENNVAYAYPIMHQANFHREESELGYLQLVQGQDYLFSSSPDFQLDPDFWTQDISFHQDEQLVSRVPFAYDNSLNRLTFEIPDELIDGKITTYQINNTLRVTDEQIDATFAAVEADLIENLPDGATADNVTSLVVQQREIFRQAIDRQETELYRLDFRTSQYATFRDKAAALIEQFTSAEAQQLTVPTDTIFNDDGTIFYGPYQSIDDFIAVIAPTEAFDEFDLGGEQVGNRDFGRLVRAEAQLSGTPQNWYGTHPGPNVYDRFAQNSTFSLDWRAPVSQLGAPPVRAIDLRQNAAFPEPPRLTDDNVTGNFYDAQPQDIQLRYRLPFVMHRDHSNYWNQVANYSIYNTLTPDLEAFLDWYFVYPYYGSYSVELQYFLPGKTTPNSTYTTSINYQAPSSKK